MLNELNALESKVAQVSPSAAACGARTNELREQLTVAAQADRNASPSAWRRPVLGSNNWPNNCPKARHENADLMPNETHFLDITLLGKEYRVACPPDQRAALLTPPAYVDGKMRDIAEKTRNNVGERVAVMAALNIAHEHLGLNQKTSAETSGD
jgi:cell division protein ZapA (FtsZ GTPase activity inhibitor)